VPSSEFFLFQPRQCWKKAEFGFDCFDLANLNVKKEMKKTIVAVAVVVARIDIDLDFDFEIDY